MFVLAIAPALVFMITMPESRIDKCFKLCVCATKSHAHTANHLELLSAFIWRINWAIIPPRNTHNNVNMSSRSPHSKAWCYPGEVQETSCRIFKGNICLASSYLETARHNYQNSGYHIAGPRPQHHRATIRHFSEVLGCKLSLVAPTQMITHG